jgi:hypothetical protein
MSYHEKLPLEGEYAIDLINLLLINTGIILGIISVMSSMRIKMINILGITAILLHGSLFVYLILVYIA